MSQNSPDYLTYKKNKAANEEKKPNMSRTRVALWVFLITFSVIFAIVVQIVRRYSTKIDIEYGRNQEAKESDTILSQGFGADVKHMIDKRLRLIQLEETAPSEAKVVEKEKDDTEVIDFESFEKIKEDSLQHEDDAVSIKKIETKTEKEMEPAQSTGASDIVTYSKVLIGKYPSFEEARAAQDEVRNINQGSTPFIRKVGDVYALQVGSFQDISVARNVAAKFRAANFDVWIYQQ